MRKSSLTLNNLVVKGNHATATNSGSGIYVSEGHEILASNPATSSILTISNTSILNNLATGSGGGIHIVGTTNYTSRVALTDVALNGNRATVGGGMRLNESIIAALQNVVFNKNVGTNGGALYVNNNTTLNITNSTFGNNEGTNGGALYALTDATITIDKSSFLNNKITTTGGGGALYGGASSTLNITNTIFSGNQATNGNGGALYLVAAASVDANNVKFFRNLGNVGGAINTSATSANNRINNAVFFKNESITVGGAIAFLTAARLSFIGNTFYGNEAGTNGGALRLGGSDVDVKVYNSILYGNSGGTTEDISITAGVLDLKYAITQKYGTDGTNGVQVGVNPQFLNVTDVDNAGFLRLSPSINNPAIDAGNNDFVPLGVALDLAGNNRIFLSGLGNEATVDLGAYENISTPLPVKLNNFSADLINNNIHVSWLTLSESDNSHFELERSIDGVTFTRITTVPSKGDGARYNYIDVSAVRGVNYYRLIQIDYNGSRSVYDPISIDFSFNPDANVSVYPNPVTNGKITANFGEGKFKTLELIDFKGQKRQQININPDEREKVVDLSMCPSGVYFLILQGKSTITKKVILAVE